VQGTQIETLMHSPSVYHYLHVYLFLLLLLLLNTTVTVQTLIDVFTISGIVHYGTTGSSNDSMSFDAKLVAYKGLGHERYLLDWNRKIYTQQDVDKDAN
jgi:hypothetical protein